MESGDGDNMVSDRGKNLKELELTEKEAGILVASLCLEVGLPIPIVKIVKKESYLQGVYDTATMEITLFSDTGKAKITTIIHEWLHYVFHLVSVAEEGGDETLEHRVIEFLTPIVAGLVALRWKKGFE